ncbi:sensor histidine kinase [Bacillus sp. 1P06AnD]|uniref:sensor histidine kinase n=1 Tax=Bacillus sp. 1P06AnD TaxID=3132208 RepID=UPI0039A065AB
MKQNDIIKKQQIVFMSSHFVSLIVIFTFFSFVILSFIQSTLYEKPDDELFRYKEQLENHASVGYGNNSGPIPLNPRIIIVRWDKHGEILNKDQLGTINYSLYFRELSLDKSAIGQINTISLNDSYTYRSLLFQPDQRQDGYIQLLINIDPEESMIAAFKRTIILWSVVFIVISLFASYLLTKKSMRPIIKSWNRQSEFVEDASHELRTPLTIIQNKLELLLTKPNGRIIDSADDIALSLSETRRLSKLTSDLLTLARADSAQSQLEKEEVQIDSFIENICIPFEEIAQSQNKRFSYQLNSHQLIMADQNRLHQLMVILLDNALKYTSANHEIRITSHNDKHKVIITVEDSGIGISPENAKQLFQRFYREEQARSREKGGTGLGLTIAEWIVHAHGGSIDIKPRVPTGTIVSIYIPYS